MWFGTICNHCGNKLAVERKTNFMLPCPYCEKGTLEFNGKSVGVVPLQDDIENLKRVAPEMVKEQEQPHFFTQAFKKAVEGKSDIFTKTKWDNNVKKLVPVAEIEKNEKQVDPLILQNRIDNLLKELDLAERADYTGKADTAKYEKCGNIAMKIFKLSNGKTVPPKYIVKGDKLRRQARTPAQFAMISAKGVAKKVLCPYCNQMFSKNGMRLHEKACRKLHANHKAISVPLNDRPAVGVLDIVVPKPVLADVAHENLKIN